MDLSSISNMICLKCHKAAGAVAPAPPAGWPADGYPRDGITDRLFSGDDASNALGNNNSATLQTSHNWASLKVVPGAGAQAPLNSAFQTNYGATNNSLACSTCHLPHEDTDNPQLLAMGAGTANDMCVDCHRAWDQAPGNNGLLTHPMVTDYSLYDGTPGFKVGLDNKVNSAVALVNGGISCTTCHGVHWVDSDSATVDGFDQAINPGDGNLLLADGSQVIDAGTGLPTGGSVCNVCHDYDNALHGANGGAKPVGCLACHGGHNYNDGNPTWYMLNDPTGSYAGGATPPVDLNTAWVGTEGVVDGFCETCHGDITTWNNATKPTLDRDHDYTADKDLCSTCHVAHKDGSFSEAAGCNDCHGWPPADSTGGGPNATGFADANIAFGGFPATNYRYNSASFNGGITYLDESTTAHATHALGGTNQYNFACSNCHQGNTHNDANAGANNNPTFQDVFIDTTGLLATTGGLTPGYTGGNNTCDTVYCHSDGVTAARTIAGPNAQTVPNWDTGVDGLTNCASCHNTGTTGTAVAHASHLALTIDGAQITCGSCHDDTWAATNDLKNNVDGSIVDTHVNAVVDLAFNVTLNTAVMSPALVINQTNGTCAVYCHSDGTTYVEVPDWDLTGVGGSGECGDCHGAALGAGLSGAHDTHLNSATLGLTIGCADCHTHDGNDFGVVGYEDHINASLDVVYANCETCHGATIGVTTGDDRFPIWTAPTSVECRTCHAGSAIATINAKTAPTKNSFDTLGHGDAGLAGAPDCIGCHDTSLGKHFDATSGDPQLTGGTTADNAFCQTCHTTAVHYANTLTTGGTDSSDDGVDCATCHEPHGDGMGTNTDAMINGTIATRTVNNFTDRTARASYWEADNSGICQICHDPNEVLHFNRTLEEDATHFSTSGACITCHKHDTDPIFKPSADSCGACHDTLMATLPHSSHVNKNSFNTKIEDDLSDCATCHDGADQYTNTGSVNGNHQNSNTDVAAALLYNATDKTCTNSCHTSAVADGSWLDADGLNCDACHGNPPATGNHAKHITAGLGCSDCHGTVDAAGTHPLTHIDDFVDTALLTETDAQILTDMGDAVADEATVNDQAFNSAVNSFNDTTNTCSNTSCHNPSNDGHSAQWGVSTASCTLCHNDDVASGSPMTTGSHGQHINNASVIGDNFVCTDCHTDPAANNAHRNGTLQVLPALTYTGEVAIPNTGYGTCTGSCHSDPTDPILSPVWNAVVDPATVCTICHGSPQTTGDHTNHWVSTRTTNGLECASCHNDTVNLNADPLNTLTTIKAGGKHIDGGFFDVAAGGTYRAVTTTITYTQGTPSNCTANCHTVNPKDWVATSGCEACHGDLSYVGTTHTAHIDITGTIDADVSECVVCHGADVNTYTATGGDGGSGNHQNGTIQTETGISNTTCTAACHDSSAGDGNWADADGLNCTACHNNGTNDNVLANAAPATGAHAKHVTTQSMTCDNCHDAGTAVPADTTHISGLGATGLAGADQGETLTNKATPVADNATVDDSSFDHAGNTFADATNSCSNTYCHDPSNNTTAADWDTDTASCNLCHGYDRTSAAVMATGSHSAHLNAITKFGLATLEDCLACHPDNTGSNGHFISTTGPTTVKQAAQLAGTVIDGATYSYSGEVALPDSGFGSCGTTPCHNNGQGGAPSAYTWATGIADDCNTCHSKLPTTLSHNVHTGTTAYGPHPTGSTNCGECHAAGADNTTMAGQTAHINGSRDYNDGNSVANHGGIFGTATTGVVGDTTITVCNNCHGGQTAADLAKNNWPSNTSVGCESCHGDYTLANSQQDGLGATAPSEAGTNYDTWGHGKATTPASAIGGSKAVAQACTDCHDATAAGHLDGISGDDTRLNVIATKDFSVDPNGFCNACHTGLVNSDVHFDNNQTAGGTSDDAVLCTTCHDQHGQGGQQAMIDSTIQTRTVSGFTDRTLRASYANASNQGVCQVCHDQAEVLYFNRTTESLATHNSGGNCLDCHSHSDSKIFTPSGCAGCHGGGTVGATASNYWPDSVNANAENDAGEHVKHMTVLAARDYDQTLAQLLDDPASDTRQKALCEYCHAANVNDSNHAGTVNDADVFVDSDAVRHAKNMWGGNDLDAAYTGGASDTCANVDCHNSQTTTATYSWYATPGVDNNADCVMCHTVGAVGANPTTGLHNITNTGTVQQHNDNLATNGCEECHAKPAVTSTSTHVDGTWVAESGVNNDRFLATDVNFTEGVVNQTTCTPNGSLGACHSDGGAWARLWSTAADSTDEVVGSARCDVCHGQLDSWRTGLTVDHNKPAINDGSHSSCETCHVQPNLPYSFATYHNTSSPVEATTELGAPGRAVEFNTNAGYDMATNNCTNICHGNDAAHTLSGSAIFPANGLIGPTPGCNTCHFDTGGGTAGNTVSGYTFSGAGSHPQHNTTAATTYGDTGLSSTTVQYNYGCANCHPIDSANHINGTLNLTLNSTHGGAIKSLNGVANDTGGYSQTNGSNVTCSAAWCHSDAAGTFATTPNWWGGTFPTPLADGTDDYCGNCHGNQPTTTSHAPHAVGIHFDDVYTGTTGLLADAAATNAGHGDITTAMTINCNVCHANTVNQWRNDHNTQCRACHAGEGNQIVSNDASLLKNAHVNGVKDVAFSPVDPLRSKAQVRDFTATEPELDNNWTRTNGYKAGATSHDASKNSPPLDTATMWDGANCTVVCHNNNTVAWGATGVTCNNCHTQLPK
jgi:predicted CxxxxCH...CXXCH cytochrome family protein